uniref:Uncharacterized protein n=1 Tax=Anguilla anguilla TaxID=7936 RepID=A0A0E9R0A6_ANGAN
MVEGGESNQKCSLEEN